MEESRNNKRPVEKKSETHAIDHLIDDSEFDSYPDISNIASNTETTGLMYAPPQNQDEFESYQELAGMEVPKLNVNNEIDD